MTTRAGWISRLTVSLTLSLTALGAVAQETIKIGEINSYKAQPAFLGPYKNGWNLALDEVNASGDRKSTRLNSSHCVTSRMPSSA